MAPNWSHLDAMARCSLKMVQDKHLLGRANDYGSLHCSTMKASQPASESRLPL